jgi:hypothetical protein
VSLIYALIPLQCVPGAKIADICKFGDELIEQRTNAIYKNKNKAGKVVLRGVAFPVCVSVNECVCHCSPLESDTEVISLVSLTCTALCVPFAVQLTPGGEAHETSESLPDTERSFALVQSFGYELTFHLTHRPPLPFNAAAVAGALHITNLVYAQRDQIKHLPAQELCLFSPLPRPSVLMVDEGT